MSSCFNYRFSNLLGTVYRGGNLVFSPDGNSILAGVGNNISIYDLASHKSSTFAFEFRADISCLALAPNGITLLAADLDGQIHLISLISRTVLHTLKTHRNISALAFSPDGALFAVAKENHVFVYAAPGPKTREYQPFVLERVLKGNATLFLVKEN